MSRPKPPSVPCMLLLSVALGTTGCGRFREISACRSVERDVNTAVSELETLAKAKPVDELRVAKRYGALAQALQPRSLGEKPFALAVRDYIVILRATETALKKNHVEAANPQSGRPNEPRRELERLVKREHAAAARLEVECHN